MYSFAEIKQNVAKTRTHICNARSHMDVERKTIHQSHKYQKKNGRIAIRGAGAKQHV